MPRLLFPYADRGPSHRAAWGGSWTGARMAAMGGLELALWLLAVASAGFVLSGAAERLLAQRAAEGIRPVAASEPGNAASAPVAAAASGEVIGRMQIPALQLSAPITSGVETSSLTRGVGRVDGSAVPGGLGTLVLAGHRDTYLRPLEHVAKGMDIVITGRGGAYHYSVDRWEIVLPEQVDSIAIRDRPELALVTCYPFHYVGPAPKRFVVHAHLVSLTPDAGH